MTYLVQLLYVAVKQLPLSVNNSILLNRSLGCLFVGNSGVYPIEQTKNTTVTKLL